MISYLAKLVNIHNSSKGGCGERDTVKQIK